MKRTRSGWAVGQPKPFLPHHSKNRSVSRDGQFKHCRTCGARKWLISFHRSSASPDGRQVDCKDCSAKRAIAYRNTSNGRAARLKASKAFNLHSNYGLTRESYMAMHDAQGGLCAICGKPETSSRLGTLRRLAVDHDHNTNKTRGLLCNACNHGIGKFHDDPDLLEAAAAYIRKHRG